MKMHNHSHKGTPPHPSSSGDQEDELDAEMIYDDDDEEFDQDDMIEILDDENDVGNLADDEEEPDIGPGPGLEGFTGQQPDHILTSHLQNAVFCCCFNGDGNLLVTGGEDDLANVWDGSSLATQSPVFKCRGHKDSVVNVSFSWDSSYLATSDLSGVVKVWKTPSFENVITFETGELSWSFWHFATNVLFAGCDDGSIHMWKIPSGDCKVYLGSSAKCECGVLLPDGKELLAGYADGNLKIFDLKSGLILHNLTKAFKHPCQILCVAAHPTRQVVASGSSDGTVALFNSQNGKLFTTLQVCPPNSDDDTAESDSVEGLSFCNDSTLDYLACGSITGNIVIWDLATMTERIKIHQDAGLTKLLWHPKSPTLFSAGIDGVVRVIDARTCTVEKLLGRHKTETLDINLTKEGHKLASTSEDGSVFVFDLTK